jgi:large subunit ribosomal protein L35
VAGRDLGFFSAGRVAVPGGVFISVRRMEDGEMPKLKTKRGAAKRFKATGTGKILRSKAFSSHILTKKSTKRKRNLRKSTLVDSANRKSIARLVPYL